MRRLAIVAALEREVSGLIRECSPVKKVHEGRNYIFFEREDLVLVCGGIGVEAARCAAEAVIALYQPVLVQSVGFAGGLKATSHVGDIFSPAIVLDARDGSRTVIAGGEGTLVTYMAVAGREQKCKLAEAYGAQAVDMEAAEVAAAAHAHGIPFTATKVISDGLDFEMPSMERFIDSHGRFKTAGFALYVALRPWLWQRVVILASNSRKAARVLAEHLKELIQHSNSIVEAKTT